ncbi:hypothetical protein D3C80_2183990 [compost metagenome]
MWNQAALAFEHHVAPTAAAATRLVGLRRQAGRAQQPYDQALAKQSLIHYLRSACIYRETA